MFSFLKKEEVEVQSHTIQVMTPMGEAKEIHKILHELPNSQDIKVNDEDELLRIGFNALSARNNGFPLVSTEEISSLSERLAETNSPIVLTIDPMETFSYSVNPPQEVIALIKKARRNPLFRNFYVLSLKPREEITKLRKSVDPIIIASKERLTWDYNRDCSMTIYSENSRGLFVTEVEVGVIAWWDDDIKVIAEALGEMRDYDE